MMCLMMMLTSTEKVVTISINFIFEYKKKIIDTNYYELYYELIILYLFLELEAMKSVYGIPGGLGNLRLIS